MNVKEIIIDVIVLIIILVMLWIIAGREVRIFTARACIPEQVQPIKDWLNKHLGHELPVTNVKDFSMIELWDDRAVQIIPNTGRRADGGA